jgi:hypothetical protein
MTGIPPSEFREIGLANVQGRGLYFLCSVLLGTLGGFYISNYMYYWGARVLGGQRRPRAQLYLQSLFAIPLGIAASLAELVPYAGALIAFGLGIYMLVVDVRVIKVVHKLTTGKAVISIFLVPLVFFLMGIAGILCVVLVFVVAGMGNVIPR